MSVEDVNSAAKYQDIADAKKQQNLRNIARFLTAEADYSFDRSIIDRRLSRVFFEAHGQQMAGQSGEAIEHVYDAVDAIAQNYAGNPAFAKNMLDFLTATRGGYIKDRAQEVLKKAGRVELQQGDDTQIPMGGPQMT